MRHKNFTLILLLLLTTLLLIGCSPEAPDNSADKEAIVALEAKVAEQKTQIETLELSKTASELENTALKLEIEDLTSSSSTPTTLLGAALEVTQALADQDMTVFSSYVHPTLGVRFTPYGYVDPAVDLSYPSTAFATLLTDTTTYTWGSFDGSGEPIIYTFADYFDNFIYDEDYVNPDLVGLNNTIGTGNSLINLSTIYPSASFVEFHFTGFDPQYEGIDWSSLILVFENVSGDWKLVGVVHNQWTI